MMLFKYKQPLLRRVITVACLGVFLVTTSYAGFKYGNYCGTGTADNFNKRAVDQLDAICKAHDECCSCSTKLGLTMKTKAISICAVECNRALLSKLSRYIKNNCRLWDIRKGKKRFKLCNVARAGEAYAVTLGHINFKQIKCVLSKKNKICKEQLRSCISRVKWPSDSQLKLK